MRVRVTKPRLRKFIESEIHEDLDSQTVRAIARADREYARGEFVEWRDVRGKLRKRYVGKHRP